MSADPSPGGPSVSVVMPFGGDVSDAVQACGVLHALAGARERILADNTASLAAESGIRIVAAAGERSPAHARNAGAAAAGGEWLLFLDSDCEPPPDLIERYFASGSPPAAVGALVGPLVPAGTPRTLAERYAAARNFLDVGAHLAHPYLPRAAAANLLVRRAAFEAVGGFHEGLRAGEDTDFCWRLQRAGWRLELAPDAVVGHRYRGSLAELRRQWRGYAAGRAWLGRRWEGFEPQPALARVVRRGRAADGPGARKAQAAHGWPLRAVDLVLAAEELIGLQLSNRPAPPPDARGARRLAIAATPPRSVGAGVHVEAARRGALGGAVPDGVALREDDGALDRWRAALLLGAPRAGELGPPALRLRRAPRPVRAAGVRVLSVGAEARRIAKLARVPVRED